MSTPRMPARTRPAFGGIFTPAYRAYTIMISFGIAVHGFNELGLAPVLPLALDELNGLDFLAWSYAMFFAAVISGGVTSSALTAEIGARGTALAGSVLYVAGILLIATAGSPEQILVGRVAQGLGDGWITALCYSMIPKLYPRSLVPQVFAFEAAIWAGASILGPTFGGAATDHIDWRLGVCVSLPVIIGVALSAGALPKERGLPSERMRPKHLASVVASVIAILVMIIPSVMPEQRLAALAIPVGLLLLLAVLHHDATRKDPLFPAEVLRLSGTVGLGGWVLLLIVAGQSISTVFMAYMVTTVFGLSAQLTGLVVVTLPMAWVLSAIPVGRVDNETVLRWMVRTGPIYQVIGACCIITGFTVGSLTLVVIGQCTIGLGLGTIWGPIHNAVFSAAQEQERSRVAALIAPVTSIGYVLGSGVGGWLAAALGLFDGSGIEATPSPQVITALWGTMIAFAVLALMMAQGIRLDSDTEDEAA